MTFLMGFYTGLSFGCAAMGAVTLLIGWAFVARSEKDQHVEDNREYRPQSRGNVVAFQRRPAN